MVVSYHGMICQKQQKQRITLQNTWKEAFFFWKWQIYPKDFFKINLIDNPVHLARRKATQPLFNSLVYVLCRYLPILHCVVHSVVLMMG